MPEIVAKNVRVYIAGKNLSRNLSESELTISQENIENTKFGSSGKERKAGLQDFHVMGSGFFESGASSGSVYYSDPILQNIVASTGRMYAVLPQGTGLGNVCYFSRALNAEYAPGGQIGDMFGFSFSADGEGNNLHRGQIMEIGSLATSDTQTVRNLGAVSSTQRLHLCLSMDQWSSSQAGTTVEIVTDNASGMATPTTTFSVAVKSSDYEGIGYGQITSTNNNQTSGDNWYRVDLIGDTTLDTVSGLVALAISPGTS